MASCRPRVYCSQRLVPGQIARWNGGVMSEEQPAAEEATRYSRGQQLITAINGEVGTRFVEALEDIAPGLAHDIVAYGFGDVYSRPGLAPPQRQLVTLGMLTALGGCEPQLKTHIEASLNVGLSPIEIVEALSQASVYCGFPRALNAVLIAKQVFADRELLPVEWSSVTDDNPVRPGSRQP